MNFNFLVKNLPVVCRRRKLFAVLSASPYYWSISTKFGANHYLGIKVCSNEGQFPLKMGDGFETLKICIFQKYSHLKTCMEASSRSNDFSFFKSIHPGIGYGHKVVVLELFVGI